MPKRSKTVKVLSRGYANESFRRFDQGPIPEVWVVITRVDSDSSTKCLILSRVAAEVWVYALILH